VQTVDWPAQPPADPVHDEDFGASSVVAWIGAGVIVAAIFMLVGAFLRYQTVTYQIGPVNAPHNVTARYTYYSQLHWQRVVFFLRVSLLAFVGVAGLRWRSRLAAAFIAGFCALALPSVASTVYFHFRWASHEHFGPGNTLISLATVLQAAAAITAMIVLLRTTQRSATVGGSVGVALAVSSAVALGASELFVPVTFFGQSVWATTPLSTTSVLLTGFAVVALGCIPLVALRIGPKFGAPMVGAFVVAQWLSIVDELVFWWLGVPSVVRGHLAAGFWLDVVAALLLALLFALWSTLPSASRPVPASFAGAGRVADVSG
jgi:hypothetical protein